MENDIQSKARVAEARHAASALLKDAKIVKGPVTLRTVIESIPKRFNLIVRGTDKYIPEGVDAFTHKEPGLTIIGFNTNVAVVRQKFSVAHEIGHLYMGHLHGKSSIDLDSTDFDEIEANQFAAHLIMPTTFLRRDIKQGSKSVFDLAMHYGVSEEAMWWQLSKSGLINRL